MVRRRSENDDLRLHGWTKFFYELFLFITFPLRKPVKFVIVLLFLFAIAHVPVLTHQVEREDLWEWYKEKTGTFVDSLKDGFAELKKEYFPEENGQKNAKKRKKRAKNAAKMQKNPAVENYAKKYDKQTAEKKMREYAGDEADKIYQYRMEEYENPQIHNTGRKNPYYGTASKFNLSYPEEILEVSGDAIVINANELIVSGVKMFLFGIYSDPDGQNYQYAKKYLEEETGGKRVRCEIMAYSAQGVATAECYIGVKSLNSSLVSMGMAGKVM